MIIFFIRYGLVGGNRCTVHQFKIINQHDTAFTAGKEVTIFTCRSNDDNIFGFTGQITVFQINRKLLPDYISAFIERTFRLFIGNGTVSYNIFIGFRKINRITRRTAFFVIVDFVSVFTPLSSTKPSLSVKAI